MISLWLLLMGSISANTGTVTAINEETHVIEVSFDAETENRVVNLPAFLIPCTIEEGQTLFFRKTPDMTLIRCSEFPVMPPTNPTLEVRVNPTTGEMQYVIQNIPLE
tara:strand:+ start:19 stop:339 length:321 start_codon:yes stop_codon:yes gene_type:complete